MMTISPQVTTCQRQRPAAAALLAGVLASALLGAACPGSIPPEAVRRLDGGATPDWPRSYFQSDGQQSSTGKPELSSDGGHLPAADAQPLSPDLVDQGQWYQANKATCPTFCGTLGKTSLPGPEGAHCMSGEVRSISGIVQGIQFPWGCWTDCLGQGQHQAQTDGKGHCYMPGQKQDNDDTDFTVACFCR